MADKKVPQEPCVFCDQNPCRCGNPISRRRVLRDRHDPKKTKEVLHDELAREARGDG